MKGFEKNMSSPLLKVSKGDRISQTGRQQLYSDNVTTKDGVVNATLALLFATVAAAVATVAVGLKVSIGIATMIGVAGGIVLMLSTVIMIFSRSMRSGDHAKVMGFILALAQGAMLGGFTCGISTYDYKGVSGWSLAGQAIMATIALFFVALLLYKTGAIRVSSGFTKFIVFASGAFGILYGVNFIIALSTGHNLLMADGPIPIIIAIAAIILGTMSLIQDFDTIDQMVEAGSDKKYQWALATAVASSLVWLYMEILRLLVLVNRS